MGEVRAQIIPFWIFTSFPLSSPHHRNENRESLKIHGLQTSPWHKFGVLQGELPSCLRDFVCILPLLWFPVNLWALETFAKVPLLWLAEQSHSKGSEPRPGLLPAHWEVRGKGPLETHRCRGQPGTSCRLLPRLQVWRAPLEFRRKKKRAHCGSLDLRLLIFLWPAGVLGETLGAGGSLNRVCISSPGVSFNMLIHQNVCLEGWGLFSGFIFKDLHWRGAQTKAGLPGAFWNMPLSVPG